MLCPTCSADCRPNQKFCGECGVLLPHLPPAGSAPAFPPPVLVPVEAAALPADDPAPTQAVEAIQPFVFEPVTALLDMTDLVSAAPGAITIVEQTHPSTTDVVDWDAGLSTQEQPVWPVDDPTPTGILMPIRGARSTALALFASAAGIAAIVASFLPQLSATSDAPIPNVLGNYLLNDLATAAPVGGVFTGTNLQGAIIVAGALMLLGGIASAFGRRLGAGLAGGAALSLVPFMVIIWDNITKITDAVAVQAQIAKQSTGVGSVVNTAPAAGFYMLGGAAILGLIALVLSAIRSPNDDHPPLNATLAILGALASLTMAAGQLVPQNSAHFSDNFSTKVLSSAAVVSRLEIVVLVAGCCIAGFARRNRWGHGFVLGSVGIYVWQWVSSIAELGTFPVPPAFGNPGNDEFTPHLVTTVGLAVLLVCIAAGVVVSAQQRKAHR